MGEAGIAVIKAAKSITRHLGFNKGEKTSLYNGLWSLLSSRGERSVSVGIASFSVRCQELGCEICEDLLPEPRRTVGFGTNNPCEGLEAVCWSRGFSLRGSAVRGKKAQRTLPAGLLPFLLPRSRQWHFCTCSFSLLVLEKTSHYCYRSLEARAGAEMSDFVGHT